MGYRFWGLIMVGLLYCSFQGLFASQVFVSFDAGIAKLNIPADMFLRNGSFYDNDMAYDRYRTQNRSQAVLGLSTGLQVPYQSHWLSQLWFGLAFQHFFKRDIGQSIEQYSLPEFNNYRYHWYIQPTTLMAISRAVIPIKRRIDGFVQLGIGAGTIETMGYQENANDNVTPRATPAWTNHHQIKMTYAATIGLQRPVYENMLVSLGYQYQYFGRLNSGTGSGLWSQSWLSLKKVDAHMAMIGLTVYSSNMA